MGSCKKLLLTFYKEIALNKSVWNPSKTDFSLLISAFTSLLRISLKLSIE